MVAIKNRQRKLFTRQQIKTQKIKTHTLHAWH